MNIRSVTVATVTTKQCYDANCLEPLVVYLCKKWGNEPLIYRILLPL